MVSFAAADAAHAEAGIVADPAKGGVYVVVFDCGVPPGGDPQLVVGATIDPPPGATVLYQGPTGIPDADLTATSSNGSAVLLGVEPGEVDITVHAGPVTYRARPVRVIAGGVTHSLRHP